MMSKAYDKAMKKLKKNQKIYGNWGSKTLSEKAVAQANNVAMNQASTMSSAFIPPVEDPGAFSKLYDYLTPPKDETPVVVDDRQNPISNDLRSFFGFDDGASVPTMPSGMSVPTGSAPEVNPQTAAAAFNSRVAPAPNYAPQPQVAAPVQAPVRAPVQQRQVPVQQDIPLEQRGMYVPDRQVRADVHNIMDFDNGSQGRGYEW